MHPDHFDPDDIFDNSTFKYYAGIGTRQLAATSTKLGCPWLTTLIIAIANKLNKCGYTLTSGGANGCDFAFQMGAAGNHCIYRPEMIPDNHASLEHAAQYHPAWHKCSAYVKRLHARNSIILLGEALNAPVKFVICLTPDGLDSGGTGQGIRIARAYNIPVFNLYYPEIRERFKKFVEKD